MTPPLKENDSKRCCAVYDDVTGEVLGAVGFDIALDHMTNLLRGYKIGRNGYLLLLSENGTLLYHPQNEYVEKNIREINISQNVADAVSSKSSKFLKYKADGITKYGSLEPLAILATLYLAVCLYQNTMLCLSL